MSTSSWQCDEVPCLYTSEPYCTRDTPLGIQPGAECAPSAASQTEPRKIDPMDPISAAQQLSGDSTVPEERFAQEYV